MVLIFWKEETKTMLMEKMKDQWICSCGNWVDGDFQWCPSCCEDQDGEKAGGHPRETDPAPSVANHR
jgi:hypothetical protein